MSIAHLLEDFSRAIGSSPAVSAISETMGETELLASFEEGYKAGWDDAVKAKNEERSHISTELGRNLQDLSFTFQEARADMIDAIRPLFLQIIETVLPETARHALGAHILEQLEKLPEIAAPTSVEIAVHPVNQTAVSECLEQCAAMPVDVSPDPTLSETQARIQLGKAEHHIDLDQVINDVGTAIDAALYESRKEQAHDRTIAR